MPAVTTVTTATTATATTTITGYCIDFCGIIRRRNPSDAQHSTRNCSAVDYKLIRRQMKQLSNDIKFATNDSNERVMMIATRRKQDHELPDSSLLIRTRCLCLSFVLLFFWLIWNNCLGNWPLCHLRSTFQRPGRNPLVNVVSYHRSAPQCVV